ncbi:MAG: reverse transcriptase-like protein [Nitrosopumilus sp. H8]|nr:MAG: reverse transcriptase-like protein [Nitrosopumilus sp. H8]
MISVYVDGSGGERSGYGFYTRETGESLYEKKPGITNNQAEYMAIIAALKRYAGSKEEITIHSDSKNTVHQLNHEYAINSPPLRLLAQEAWGLMTSFSALTITWIPRGQNLAGKMMGS